MGPARRIIIIVSFSVIQIIQKTHLELMYTLFHVFHFVSFFWGEIDCQKLVKLTCKRHLHSLVAARAGGYIYIYIYRYICIESTLFVSLAGYGRRQERWMAHKSQGCLSFWRAHTHLYMNLGSLYYGSTRVYYASTKVYYASENMKQIKKWKMRKCINRFQVRLLNNLNNEKGPYDDSASF
jgi:hypothetical protein